jgi:hypothetical protein
MPYMGLGPTARARSHREPSADADEQPLSKVNRDAQTGAGLKCNGAPPFCSTPAGRPRRPASTCRLEDRRKGTMVEVREQAWDDLKRGLPFLTVCGYPARFFDAPAANDLFLTRCAPHSAVFHEA